jgi:hypothetical protein
VVEFFHLNPEGGGKFFGKNSAWTGHPPVDEVRAPGFAAGLIPNVRSGRKSKDQRIPSGHAIARTLPPNSRIHPAFLPEKTPG